MQNLPSPVLRRGSVAAVALASLAFVAASLAQTAPASTPAPERPLSEEQRRAIASNESAGGKPLELSPFTVRAERDSGYFAENTLAGSRIQTNLADLAASITVVTRQQMEDTASVDINDIFKYEANTEGASSYSPSIVDRGTVKDTIAGYTFGNNGDTTTHAQSNRVRGLGAPDAGMNNYPVNNRIPLDAYNTQSVEISRGPNSLLFGLGSPAGIVNQNTSYAILNQTNHTVNLRADHNGSMRTSFAFNRPLVRDRLAVNMAFLYDNREFERKPSSDRYRRQYAAVTFKPFEKTVLRAFVENYENDANRPNFFTPRDWVTPWLQSGRPVYDALSRTVRIQDTGAVRGPYLNSNLSPGFVSNAVTPTGFGQLSNVNSVLYVPGIFFNDTSRPIRLIDGTTVVGHFQRNPTAVLRQADTSPAVNTSAAGTFGFVPRDPRYMILDRGWTSSGGLRAPVPAGGGSFGSWQNPGVTDRSIYDWTEHNLLQPNFGEVQAANFNVELEQQILPNLFFNAGWLRQDIEEWANYTISQLQGATIAVDTNLYYPDGTPNPYVGLPYIFEGEGGGLDTYHNPETVDNYRAMLAYDLDLRNNEGWTRWLGRHRILGLWSKQDSYRQTERWRMNYTDGEDLVHRLFTSNLAVAGTRQPLSTATKRLYYLASPGDPEAAVSHAAGYYGNQGWRGPFGSPIRVYNPYTNTFVNQTITEQILFTSAGNNNASQRVVDTQQLALQSYLWGDRLIATLGWRKDKYQGRVTTDGTLTDDEGNVIAPAMTNEERFVTGVSGVEDLAAVINRWNRWDRIEGSTKTLGAAFRPFQNHSFIRGLGGEGSQLVEFLDGLTFYYNESDNFNPPQSFQTDMFGKPLPKPTGSGRDGGFGFTLFNEKLVARVNWYETENENERTNAAGTLLTRSSYADTTLGLPWASAVLRLRRGMQQGMSIADIVANNNWNSDQFINISSEADQRALYDMIELPYLYYNGISRGATQQSKAKGVEVQVTYNPTRNWTMKFTAAKNESTYNTVAPEYDAWIAERMPVWLNLAAPDIPDFVDANGRAYSLGDFWSAYGYAAAARIENTDGNTSTQAYFQNNVESIVALAKALEGAVSPSLRKYQASFLTNYRFDNDAWGGRLKGVAIGGSARWQSKAAIGYLGKVGNPVNSPGVINLNDVTRPIYDDGIFNSDLWISYSTRIYNDKVGLKLQLNCNNWTESGRLQPTQVNFDGSPWAFRIIDPRMWIAQATFTF